MTPAEGAGPVLYNAEDVQFLHHMSMHHQQALDMAALAPERTDNAVFLQFTRYVARAQGAEITMMEGMLEMAAARGLAAHGHDMSGDPPMAGMLSRAEMDALEAARGDDFVRLWLEGMIVHHEGGLAMARAQQLQQLHHGRRPYGLEGLVETILEEQRAEIVKMRGWLDEWGLAEGGQRPDRRLPAVEVASPVPGAVIAAGEPATAFGLAVDDTDIADVRVAIQDLASEQWLRRDGTWGGRQLLPVDLARSGPSSVAWRFAWTPPAPGRYGVVAEAEDAVGKRAAGRAMREVTAE